MELDAVDEIVEHAEELYRSLVAGGRSPSDARAMTEAEMVNLPALMRAARASKRRRVAAAPEPASGRFRPVSAFFRDVIYGVRLLAARPTFTAVAVLTLALGIGANTAIFSIVHALLLAPLPFPEPERLVMLWELEVANPENPFIVSAPNWQDWRRQSTSFEQIAIWETLRFNLAGEQEPEQVLGMRASSGLFPMLGVRPQLGRTFTEAEEAPGHQVVVISDGVWRRRFGGQTDAVGRTMKVNGKPHEVIGVMPATFIFEQARQEVWVPIAFNAEDGARDSHSFRAAARLKPGVSFDAAKAELQALGTRLAAEYRENRGESATMTRMSEQGVAYLKPTLYALLGAVGLVLLIACVNVANLLLAQASARGREFAIRAALGAGRGRLVSQLLAEGLLLAFMGGVAGIALAWLGTSWLSTTLPPGIRLAPFRTVGGAPVNPIVLAFTFAIAGLTGVLFSLAPIVGVARSQPVTSIKGSGDRGGTARFTGLRGVLVGVEVALALVVLAAAGLMIKSVSRLIAVDPGLDLRGVLVMDVALPQADFYGPPERTTFCEDLDRNVSAVPGVLAVGAISHLPLSGANAGRGITIEGRPVPTPEDEAGASYRLTCPGYFRALGIPLVRGRDFPHGDTVSAPGAVIINETMAKAYWQGRDPIGTRLKLGGANSTNPWATVVGVVKDVRHFGLQNEFRREMFRPYSQLAWPSMTVTVKAANEPMALASPVRGALRHIDPEGPVTRIRTMEDVLEESMGARKFPMLLLGGFSLVALVLAAIGVYGVVSYIVSQRTREIGIRMALGARAAEVVRMVVRRSMTPIAAGIVVGVLGSIWASRLLGTLLYEVKPHDPVVLGSIVLVLGGSAVAASLVPARRAASVDPLIVLKEE
jgi:putative ABC transport system permease protein